MNRRDILRQGLSGAAGLALVGAPGRSLAQGTAFAPQPGIVPVLARADRIFRVTVCLRPFRAAGPRIAVEQIGRKRVVHHYGHGGSGWSLSWGSAQEAVPLALADGATEIAVIGAGAIGLTTAITAQRMGAKVTIYAKERFPLVRSARATGTWSPDSRIGMVEGVAAGFADRWEQMARASFAFHQRFLGLAGDPVEWSDRYSLSDAVLAATPDATADPAAPPTTGFLRLEDRLADLTPGFETLAPGTHPFAFPNVRKSTSLTFNVADLSHQLESDFLLGGGRFVAAEFHAPSELSRIREKVIVNCTGYGARALFRDESVVPVRGQIAWLIPQPGVTYGIYHARVSLLARRDGIVVQPIGQDDFFGYKDDNETPDYAAARAGVEVAATMFRPRVLQG